MVRGFILIDIIIASLILTAAVAATMYLFRIGFKELEQSNTISKIVSKIPQAVSYLKTVDFKTKPQGDENLGEVKLTWDAKLTNTGEINTTKNPLIMGPMATDMQIQKLPYKLYLYHVDFYLSYKNYKDHYDIDILKYKYLGPTGKQLFNVPIF
ncbi:MAG: hypothetical protein C0170_00665 [Hydrogenobaculum sp.]|nr:MAG: hypothetical protein C0170_00665 [Hydrogenobaculum sp.]